MYSVFIADDNMDWLEALSIRIHQEQDFQVVASANNGNTAIQLIERLKPDILIIDIIMPENDGVYIVNYIRAKLTEYNPIIYILSGIGTDTIVKILNDLHIDFYSLKPISLDIVIQNLRQIVHQKSINHDYSNSVSSLTHEQVIDDVLSKLGLFPHLMSTKYIYEALVYYLNNQDNFRMLTKVIYPAIAQKNNSTAGAVEKNIRLGIKQIKKVDSHLYKEIFFSESNKKVTNSMFLSVVSNYIRKKMDNQGVASILYRNV